MDARFGLVVKVLASNQLHNIWLQLQFMEQFLLSSARTEDPSEANLFYMPLLRSHYGGTSDLLFYLPLGWPRKCCHPYAIRGDVCMHAGNEVTGDPGPIVNHVVDYIRQNWPYWNRTGGRDHFFVRKHSHTVWLLFRRLKKSYHLYANMP